MHGRCSTAENVHGRFPYQEKGNEPGNRAAILHRR